MILVFFSEKKDSSSYFLNQKIPMKKFPFPPKNVKPFSHMDMKGGKKDLRSFRLNLKNAFLAKKMPFWFVVQRLQQKNIKNGVLIILYLFQLNENSVLLRFSFPIIFHFEFRLKVTINQSFPSTVNPPSKSIKVCQINEKGNFRRISDCYPNLRFPDWILIPTAC